MNAKPKAGTIFRHAAHAEAAWAKKGFSSPEFETEFKKLIRVLQKENDGLYMHHFHVGLEKFPDKKPELK